MLQRLPVRQRQGETYALRAGHLVRAPGQPGRCAAGCAGRGIGERGVRLWRGAFRERRGRARPRTGGESAPACAGYGDLVMSAPAPLTVVG
ncbi:MAG: hypothetical protein ABJQ67_09535, partial [Marinobacter sp.]